MHHHNRALHDETTKPRLASTRSKFRQRDQRLASEQAMRDYKAAEIEQERKTEELRELRLNFRGRAPGICQGPMRFASKAQNERLSSSSGSLRFAPL
jgi:hypothetical protein